MFGIEFVMFLKLFEFKVEVKAVRLEVGEGRGFMVPLRSAY